MTDPIPALARALAADDLAAAARLLAARPELRERLDEPRFGGRPALAACRSREAASLLLEHSADAAELGRWWAPGFSLQDVDPEVARFLVERGATLSVHAAAGLGLGEELARLLEREPELVTSKGGDGCHPLHFARDLVTAELLLARGARLDARDEDHESTPAQWLIGDRPEVARFLLDRGAEPDLFLATALDDEPLARQLIAEDPARLAQRIGKLPFPSIGHRGRGGTILQWALAFNSYAHQIAAARGHQRLFRLLWEASDAPTRLLVACAMAMRPEAEALATEHPGLVRSLPADDLELLARYCWETNASLEAVRLMLDLGFPVDHPETSHGWSPLHNAAWGGYADLVDLLLERGHPAAPRDPHHRSTPLEWAIHCATVDGRHPEGEYGRVAASLLDAGSPWDPEILPTGHAEIDAALEARL